MNGSTPGRWTRMAAALVVVGGWALTLALAWPGQLSYDSIVQLHDGRTGFYHSWHPPVMAWLLGLGDAIAPGTGLYLVLVTGLFFGALLSLLWIRPRIAVTAIPFAIILLLLPQTLLYQGIVWKDVLFANAAAAGFVSLALAEAPWQNLRARIAWLGAALVLFVLAMLARQNGLIAAFMGSIAFGICVARTRFWKQGFLYGFVALIILALISAAASSLLAKRSDDGAGPKAQIALLRLYDLVGAVAADPSLKLPSLENDDPELDTLIRTDGVRLYSPQRNDTLVGSAPLQAALADDDAPAALSRAWSEFVVAHPWSYLAMRARVFAWVFLTPDIVACRPVFVGVEGPAGEMNDLGLAPRRNARDLALANYAKSFEGTPVFSHAAFAVLALAAMVLFLRRRAPGDIAMAFLLIAALAFAASFFVVSIACDYRYLYFLDLAALVSLFYLALDPDYLFQVVATCSGSSWLRRSDDRKS